MKTVIRHGTSGHKSWKISIKQVWSECHIINYLLNSLDANWGILNLGHFHVYPSTLDTAMTLSQYSPEWPQHLASKKLTEIDRLKSSSFCRIRNESLKYSKTFES